MAVVDGPFDYMGYDDNENPPCIDSDLMTFHVVLMSLLLLYLLRHQQQKSKKLLIKSVLLRQEIDCQNLAHYLRFLREPKKFLNRVILKETRNSFY